MIYAQCIKIRAYELLHINNQFQNEFSSFLDDFVLGFHIDPSSTTVNIINPDNSAWGDDFVLDPASPHPDYSILDSMPMDRFKGIRILISPPSMDDPGQVVRGWLQSIALVKALVPSMRDETIRRSEQHIEPHDMWSRRRLPLITIQVRNSMKKTWHTEGSWNITLPSYLAWDSVLKTAPKTERAFSDLEIMLLPFTDLSDAITIAIELPTNAPKDSRVDKLGDLLACRGIQEMSEMFKAVKWNNEDIRAGKHAQRVWLDYLLDDMRGPSAAELRRDRLKFWCPEYEYQITRCILLCWPSPFDGPWDVLEDKDLHDLIRKSFHDRFMSVHDHILAAYRDALRRHGEWVYIHSDKDFDFEYCLNRLRQLRLCPELGNNETFWEVCYPNGIEPKSQNDNWEKTEQIDRAYRVIPRPWPDDLAAIQMFPPTIGRCKTCGEDRSMREHTLDYGRCDYGPQRYELFRFSTRPGIPLRLGPIEPS